MNNNQVGFTLQLDVLERALRSTAAVERALIKLAKKSGLPMLSIEGDMFQVSGRRANRTENLYFFFYKKK